MIDISRYTDDELNDIVDDTNRRMENLLDNDRVFLYYALRNQGEIRNWIEELIELIFDSREI